MEALVTTLAEGDADGVRRCAHAIKGASGNIAALRMQQTAATLEKSAKEGDLTEAPQLLATLQFEYGAFIEALAAVGIVTEALETPKGV